MFGKKRKKKKAPMFEYVIENVTDESVYKAQCKSLMDNLIDLVDDGKIIDDDGSIMHYFLYRDLQIIVMWDTDLQEVYVDSPIDVGDYIVNRKYS